MLLEIVILSDFFTPIYLAPLIQWLQKQHKYLLISKLLTQSFSLPMYFLKSTSKGRTTAVY